MRTNRFEQGMVSCVKIISIGILLHIGFYLGAKLAKKMRIDTQKDVDRYKGVGISAKKYAQEHYGIKEMMVG